ncbi:peptidase S8/S53 domain-containing protein [Mycena rebaudengoi]|nr:peptidase S8/S53 domain-containing protein [Mycena rebaudengoi]
MFNFNVYIFTGLVLSLPSLSHPVHISHNTTVNVRASTTPGGTTGVNAAPGCQPIPASQIPPLPNSVPDRYMVVFDKTADLGAHLKALNEFITSNTKCSTLNNSIALQFDEPFFKFYSGQFDGRVLEFIGGVKGTSITPVQKAASKDLSRLAQNVPEGRSIDAIAPRRKGTIWSLARITQDQPVVLKTFLGLGPGQGKSAVSRDWEYKIKDGADGKGVAIYIVDSGVSKHNEFGARLETVTADYIHPDFGSPYDDPTGHGTESATAAAGTNFGVANQASIIPMKVPLRNVQSMDHIAFGIVMAVKHYKNIRSGKGGAVVNLSIDLLWSNLKPATEVALENGMHVVVAAGNDGKDMCDKIKIPDVIIVGATDIQDKKAPFSNFGSCVDLFAPGFDITVADSAHPDDYAINSGTSLAAPLVSGMIAATISASADLPPAEMKKKIVSFAKTPFTNSADFPTSKNGIAIFDPSLWAT